MPRPPYCPDTPTGPMARNFAAPPPYGRHHPRIRDLAIDYAVRYGRLDRAELMAACADPARFITLYESTNDPTVHRAIYCVELGNWPQFMLAIEPQIDDLLLSVRALPIAGKGRVWHPHMRDPNFTVEIDSVWRRVAFWEACTPERIKELPPAPDELVLKPNHVLLWGSIYQDHDGKFRVVGFEAVFDHHSEARLMFHTFKEYLWSEPGMVPLHLTIVEPAASRDTAEGDAP